MIVSWFSAGVSSAVATKMMINEIDKIIYTHIDDQHPDTMRFLKDCEQWFGREIEIMQSPLLNVETACLNAGGKGYINGAQGAACTRSLKRLVRIKWEYEQPYGIELTYVWGMDVEERDRAERVTKSMPNQMHIFPLINNHVSKQMAHEILRASGIKRPAMYDLGYHNNNCIGCVKGGQWYWNKIRKDFPDIFKKRAEMERKIGATCLRKDRPNKNLPASESNSVHLYLDELNPGAGLRKDEIMDDCGIFCEAMAI